MIKKFMIIMILAIFMIPAASASDVNEEVNIDNTEIQFQKSIEVNQLDSEEPEMDDVFENDVISEEYIAPINYNQEYSDSYMIKNPENFNEIENYQCNNTYIETLINETLNNTDLDLNNSSISVHIFKDFSRDFEAFNCMEFDSNIKTIDLGEENLSEFRQTIDKFKVLTHDDLIFYNLYCHILMHDVDKNIFISNDKLHTKFAFSIDNSIAGDANSFKFYILNSYFSNFNLFSLSCFQTFSNFIQIFMNINYYEYSFFPSKTIK